MSECAILLAAGRGRRMRRPKALLRVGREPLVAWQVRRLLDQGIDRVCVVVSLRIRDRVRRALAHEPRGSVRIVLQPHPDAPPFDSLCRGLRAVLKGRAIPALVWVLPVDVPAPPGRVFSRLRRAVSSSGVQAAIPTWRRRGGHPVVFLTRFARRLASLAPGRPESRLDVALHAQRPGAVRRVPVGDPGIHVNLNNPSEWLAFLGRSK